MKKGNVVFGLAAVIFVISVLSSFPIMGENTRMIVGDLGSVGLALLVVILGLMGFALIDKKFVDERKIWLLFGIGFALRLVGEILWAVYEIILKVEIPTPSVSDAAWWLSYIFLIFAFSYKLKHTYMENKKIVIYVMLIVCIVLSGIYAHLGYTEILDGNKDALTSFVNGFYTIFDIFVIGLILAINLPLINGYNKSMRSCFILALAFIVFGVYDYFFALRVGGGTYFSGAFIDALYYFAYFLAMYSVYSKYRLMKVYNKKGECCEK